MAGIEVFNQDVLKADIGVEVNLLVFEIKVTVVVGVFGTCISLKPFIEAFDERGRRLGVYERVGFAGGWFLEGKRFEVGWGESCNRYTAMEHNITGLGCLVVLTEKPEQSFVFGRVFDRDINVETGVEGVLAKWWEVSGAVVVAENELVNEGF